MNVAAPGGQGRLPGPRHPDTETHAMQDDDLLRPGQAAELLGLTVDQFRRRVRRGQVPEPLRTAGGHRRYRRGDVEAFKQVLDSQRNRRGEMARIPGTGTVTRVRLNEDLTVKVDAARRRGESRPAVIRRLVAAALG